MPPDNIFEDAPRRGEGEWVDTLLSEGHVRIERIVSRGDCSPEGFWYDQPENEWVILLAGSAGLRFEGEEALTLKPGDYVHIPRHRRHRVDWTDSERDTVWLAVYHAGDDRSA